MSLRIFHIVFIVVSVGLSLFVGVWGLREGRPWLAVLFLLLGAALVVYGFRAFRKLGELAVVLGAVLLVTLPAESLWACAVCYGSPEDPMVKGMRAGIWTLLGFIGFVQVGFVALFISFWRRAKMLRERREQFRLIRGELS